MKTCSHSDCDSKKALSVNMLVYALSQKTRQVAQQSPTVAHSRRPWVALLLFLCGRRGRTGRLPGDCWATCRVVWEETFQVRAVDQNISGGEEEDKGRRKTGHGSKVDVPKQGIEARKSSLPKTKDGTDLKQEIAEDSVTRIWRIQDPGNGAAKMQVMRKPGLRRWRRQDRRRMRIHAGS